jgi:hypothetical protein
MLFSTLDVKEPTAGHASPQLEMGHQIFVTEFGETVVWVLTKKLCGFAWFFSKALKPKQTAKNYNRQKEA